MNPIVIVIALIWVAVIIGVIKAFLERGKPPRLDKDTPSPDRNANKAVDVHGKAKEHAVEAPQESRGKHSTRNIVIITTIVVIAIVIIGNLSTESPETMPSQPTQYVPRYSADQVIAVARREYPICFKGNTLVSAPTEISVLYIGGTSHAWHVSIRAPEGYHWVEWSLDGEKYYVYTQTTAYFWETDGSLHDTSW